MIWVRSIVIYDVLKSFELAIVQCAMVVLATGADFTAQYIIHEVVNISSIPNQPLLGRGDEYGMHYIRPRVSEQCNRIIVISNLAIVSRLD